MLMWAASGVPFLPPTISFNSQAAVPGAFGMPATVQGGAPTPGGGGGLSEVAARREKYMLDSLLTAVEVLFFIYYSYQVVHDTKL